MIRAARWSALVCAAALAISACSDDTSGSTASPSAARLRVDIVERRPHATDSFTEGLALDDATGTVLYESSGGYGSSTLRRVDAHTGAVLQSIDIPAQYFAEGLAKVDDRLVLLTWKEHTAIVYDAATLAEVGRYAYDSEGWGLCDDGRRLVMSDGTDTLQFRDRSTFELLGTVRVKLDGNPVDDLNELECVGDAVYANVWLTDKIVQIDPSSGRVTADIDASALVPAGRSSTDDVLNGIAHDPSSNTFLLTGKHWPTLYVTRFVAGG